MKPFLTLAALSALLAGCATTGAAPPSEAGAQSLSFEAGACFGACPIYRVDIGADGQGVLHGERFTAQAGDQPITLTPAQWDAAARLFARWRPAAGTEHKILPGEPGCALVATDMPGYAIVWDRGTTREATLRFYAGCHDAANGPLREAIARFPATIGIEPLLRPAR